MASNLAVTNPIPTVLNNAVVYKDGERQLGTATVELPSFEQMTESVSGLGIAGEVEVPVVGHFNSMTVKITWNTVTVNSMELLEPIAHHLDIRADLQDHDPGTGTYQHRAAKLIVRGTPKTNSLGKLEPGKKMEGETELEVSYLKLSIGGFEVVELDKFNFIFRVNGDDVLNEVRSNLGM